MSRYASNEPDLDRYDDKPIDAQDELPDFTEPDPPITQGDKARAQMLLRRWAESDIPTPSDPPVDPAEYAVHSLLLAIAAMRRELATVTDVERAIVLKGLIRDAYIQIDDVDTAATAKITECMERRR